MLSFHKATVAAHYYRFRMNSTHTLYTITKKCRTAGVGPGCVKTPIRNYVSLPPCIEGRVCAGFLDLQFKVDL
jgi:hypothetical protein